MRLWDPATGSAVGKPLAGHVGRVRRWRLAPRRTGGCCSPPAAKTGPCGSGSRSPALPSAKRSPGTPDPVESVAFGTTGDGRLLLASGGQDGRVRLWDPVTGTAVGKPLAGHVSRVASVAFGAAADGRLVLAWGDRKGAIWLLNPVESSTPVKLFRPLARYVGAESSLAFGAAADGRLLLASGGQDGRVRLWDPVTGTAVCELRAGHVGTVVSVAFGATGDGRLLLASGGRDGRVRLWDPVTGTAVAELLGGHRGTVESVAFGTTADGRLLLASGGYDGRIQLWDPIVGTALGKPLAGHVGRVASVAFGTTADGRLLLAFGGRDRLIRLWDVVRKECVLALCRRSGIQAIAVSGPLIAIADQEGVSVIEPRLEGLEFYERAVVVASLRDTPPTEPAMLADRAGSSLTRPTSGPANAMPAASRFNRGRRTVPPRHTNVWVRIDGTWCKGRITAWIAHGKDSWECQIQAERSAEHSPWSGWYVYDRQAIRQRHDDHPPLE